MALLVPSLCSLWVWSELRAMRRGLNDWKAAQVAFAASRPTPAEILPRSEGGADTGSVVTGDDGTVRAVCIMGPQWHYAWFEIDRTGRAVGVTFSVK